MTQGGFSTAPAGGKIQNYSYNAGCSGIENIIQKLWNHAGFYTKGRVGKPGRLTPRSQCATVRVKPKVQQKPQKVVDTRNGEHLLRKTAGGKWSQPKRKATQAVTSKVIEVGQPKLFSSVLTSPDCGCQIPGHRVTEFCFGPFLLYHLFFPLEWICLQYAIVHWKYSVFFYIFTRDQS